MKSEEPPCEKVDSKMGSCQENQPFGGRDEDVFEVGEAKKERPVPSEPASFSLLMFRSLSGRGLLRFPTSFRCRE